MRIADSIRTSHHFRKVPTADSSINGPAGNDRLPTKSDKDSIEQHIDGGTMPWTNSIFEARMMDALRDGVDGGRLDLGCVAAHGYFSRDTESGTYEVHAEGKAATAFLFKLIAQLQFSGTVPMIDVQAYAQWLLKWPRKRTAFSPCSRQRWLVRKTEITSPLRLAR
jgi:hypothetical protein